MLQHHPAQHSHPMTVIFILVRQSQLLWRVRATLQMRLERVALHLLLAALVRAKDDDAAALVGEVSRHVATPTNPRAARRF